MTFLGPEKDTEEAIEDLGLDDQEYSESLLGNVELDLDVALGGLPRTRNLPWTSAKRSRLTKEIPSHKRKSTKEDLQLDRESTEEVDDLLSLDEITLEEIPLEQKPSILQKDKGKKESSAEDSDLSLDLGDLDLELDLEESKPQG
jgi:hypothetical protein